MLQCFLKVTTAFKRFSLAKKIVTFPFCWQLLRTGRRHIFSENMELILAWFPLTPLQPPPPSAKSSFGGKTSARRKVAAKHLYRNRDHWQLRGTTDEFGEWFPPFRRFENFAYKKYFTLQKRFSITRKKGDMVSWHETFRIENHFFWRRVPELRRFQAKGLDLCPVRQILLD